VKLNQAKGESFAPNNVVEDGRKENGEENTQITRKNTLKKERVYNIEVEDDHEYFANGVLVSNCFGLCFYELARMGLDAMGAVVPEHHERPEPIVQTEDGWRLNLEEALSYEE
jgi:hypothetical protein